MVPSFNFTDKKNKIQEVLETYLQIDNYFRLSQVQDQSSFSNTNTTYIYFILHNLGNIFLWFLTLFMLCHSSSGEGIFPSFSQGRILEIFGRKAQHISLCCPTEGHTFVCGHLFENSHSALITSILKGSEMVLYFQRGLGLLVVYSLIRLILIRNNKVGLKSFRI